MCLLGQGEFALSQESSRICRVNNESIQRQTTISQPFKFSGFFKTQGLIFSSGQQNRVIISLKEKIMEACSCWLGLAI